MSGANPVTPTHPVADEHAALERAEARNQELAAQLGLARAEAEGLREELAAVRAGRRAEVTRIRSASPAEDGYIAEPTRPASGPRTTLRLYGAPPTEPRPAGSVAGVQAIPGPEAPSVVGPPPAGGVRLPMLTSTPGMPEAGVPAIPTAPVRVVGAAPPAAPIQSARAVAGERYRTALRHLAERRIPQAIVGLDAFLRDHATHPYADNAMYWRAEISYTRHDYADASRRFTRLIERYPRGNKVPDALLRIGLCYERMGQRARAREVFSRLREQYPSTVAARMASREDA